MDNLSTPHSKPIETIAKIVASANLKVINAKEFVALAEDVDLNRTMEDVPLFTAEDVGTTYIIEEGASKDEETGYYTFPVYNVDKAMHLTVSALKLRATANKETSLNWWIDSKSKDGMVTAMKFVDFVEDKAGKNPVFPRWYYRIDQIAKNFGIDDEETVSELLDADYADLKGAEKTRRNRWMRWIKKQPLKDALYAEYLTKAGKPTAEALRSRYGKLVYEVLDRVQL